MIIAANHPYRRRGSWRVRGLPCLLILLGGCAAGFALFAANTTPAAAKPGDLCDRIDRLARPLIEDERVVGMTIGVIRRGRSHVFAYGETAAGSGETPTGDTVYEIGSISKAFTGVLLADMAQAGRVALDDPVRKYLPDDAPVPEHNGRPIALQHLASHTSGLPRMPNNFHPADPHNPYADYTAERMYAFLADHELRRPPGERYEYSNLGAGLLGHALAHRAGGTYHDLLLERITEPLGMGSTGIALTDEMRRRLAPGHTLGGQRAANWDIVTLAGAGGIRSTVHDMLRFLEAHLNPDDTPLGPAVTAAMEHRHGTGDGGGIGLGWHIAGDGETRWHNGQTGGYHTMAMLHPPRRVAVVILANSAQPAIDQLAERIMRGLFEDE